jgi:hypothetical protein
MAKVFEISESGDVYRIEVLKTSNPQMPFSARCYELITNGLGEQNWSMIPDFPWLGSMSLDQAIGEAEDFLEDHIKGVSPTTE